MVRVKDELKSAANWGVVDMAGGSLVTTMIKHGKLKEAKKRVAEAGRYLKRFGRELEDEQGRSTDIKIDIGEFLTFADYFIDGLIVDWIVQSKINDARKQVDLRISKVRHILKDLHARGEEAAQRLDALQQRRAEIIAAG